MGLSLNLAQSTYHYILNTYAQLPLQLPPERPSATCPVVRRIYNQHVYK